MIQHNNDKGSVTVSAAVYTEIAGTAATNCFGVKGMAARSVQDGLFHLLRKESSGKGVLVEFHDDNTITIDLHIIVDHGVNLQAVGASIISEVRYSRRSFGSFRRAELCQNRYLYRHRW